MSFLVRQSVAIGEVYNSSATVNLGEIVAGNLLVASASERSGALEANLNVAGWLPLVAHMHTPADSTYRKSLFMWYKTAEVDEPTTVTVTFDTFGAVFFGVVEYDTVTEAGGPMQLAVPSVSTGYNTVTNAYPAGTLQPFSAPRCLLLSSVITKTGPDAGEIPYGWSNETLLADVTYDGGSTSVDGAIGSLDMSGVSDAAGLTTTAVKLGTVDAERGGIVALAAFVPETVAPPSDSGLLTESGFMLLTETGQPILL